MNGILFLDKRLQMKTCTKCRESKPLDEFYNHKGRKDGKSEACKDCNKSLCKERYLKKIGGKYSRPLLTDEGRDEEKKMFLKGKKECTKCKEVKLLNEFKSDKNKKNGYSSWCKECHKQAHRNWRKNNMQKKKLMDKDYYIRNREKIIKQVNERQKNDPNRKEYMKKYAEENSTKISEYKADYQRDKRSNDPFYNFKSILSASTFKAFYNRGYSKTSKTAKLLGCEWETVKQHIERQFTKGMTWDNQGEWHVDHIIPLASANTEEELIKLCHYTNLQPLWAKDNLSKSDKMPE